MPLYHLPNELILIIAENLKSNGDLNSLIQTNTHLCKLLDPLLYRRDAASFSPLAILHAAARGNEKTAQKSLQAGLELDCCSYWGTTLLCSAAESGNDRVLKLLLANNESANPDEENSDGETPLVCAAKWGHEEVVKHLLLTGRVDVNFNCGGFTPLSYAAWNGHKAVVDLFLDADGINLDFAHPDGQTAVYLAAESGHGSVVKLLIEAGADLGSKGHHRLSPLLGAARCGYESIVKILLATGRVNPNTTNSDGETPLSLAREHRHEAIIKVLELENVFEKRDNLSSDFALQRRGAEPERW
jgi:ankyrin repeat protein